MTNPTPLLLIRSAIELFLMVDFFDGCLSTWICAARKHCARKNTQEQPTRNGGTMTSQCRLPASTSLIPNLAKGRIEVMEAQDENQMVCHRRGDESQEGL